MSCNALRTGCCSSCVMCATRTKLPPTDNRCFAFPCPACSRRTWWDAKSYTTYSSREPPSWSLMHKACMMTLLQHSGFLLLNWLFQIPQWFSYLYFAGKLMLSVISEEESWSGRNVELLGSSIAFVNQINLFQVACAYEGIRRNTS